MASILIRARWLLTGRPDVPAIDADVRLPPSETKAGVAGKEVLA